MGTITLEGMDSLNQAHTPSFNLGKPHSSKCKPCGKHHTASLGLTARPALGSLVIQLLRSQGSVPHKLLGIETSPG